MRIKALLLTAIACSVLIAACGGGSSTPAPNNTSSSTSTNSSSSSTGASSSGSSSSGGSTTSPSHCIALAGVGEKFASTFRDSITGHLNATTVAQDLRAAANVAPGAIQPDVQTVAAAFTSFANQLNKIGYKIGSIPSATQLLELQSALKSIKTAKVEQADQHIKNWVASNCH